MPDVMTIAAAEDNTLRTRAALRLMSSLDLLPSDTEQVQA